MLGKKGHGHLRTHFESRATADEMFGPVEFQLPGCLGFLCSCLGIRGFCHIKRVSFRETDFVPCNWFGSYFGISRGPCALSLLLLPCTGVEARLAQNSPPLLGTISCGDFLSDRKSRPTASLLSSPLLAVVPLQAQLHNSSITRAS